MTIATGVYRAPAAFVRGRTVLTNTPPTIPYRSAGRPEAMYLIERLMDLAARQLGIDRIEIRRRNLIGRASCPIATRSACTYDSGDLRAGDGRGAAARRLDGLSRPQGRSRQARQAARHRARQLHRDHDGRAARVVVGDREAGRHRRGAGRHAVVGAGARDDLRAVRVGMARRAVRAGPHHRARHRHHPGRRRLAFRPLDADGGVRDGQGVRRRDRARPSASPPCCSTRRPTASTSPTACSPRAAPTARSACSRRRKPGSPAPICRTS